MVYGTLQLAILAVLSKHSLIFSSMMMCSPRSNYVMLPWTVLCLVYPCLSFSRDETHNRALLTRLGSTGLVKKANIVWEDELASEYLMSRLSREYVIFQDKTH